MNCTHDVSHTLTKLLKDVRLTLTWNLPNKSLKGNFYVIVILQKVHTITYLQLAWPAFTLQLTLGLVPSVNHSKTDDWTKPLVWWFHAQGHISICTETKSSRWKREFNLRLEIITDQDWKKCKFSADFSKFICRWYLSNKWGIGKWWPNIMGAIKFTISMKFWTINML